jgi:hypothetical protein
LHPDSQPLGEAERAGALRNGAQNAVLETCLETSGDARRVHQVNVHQVNVVDWKSVLIEHCWTLLEQVDE